MKNSGLIILMLLLLVGCSKEVVEAPEEPKAQVEDIEKNSVMYPNPVPNYSIAEEVKEEWISLGEFKLTAYCSCEKCCEQWANLRPLDEFGNPIVYGASGVELQPNHSIAVDTSVIPYGTVVLINGTEYVAEDCGGLVKGNHIDVYFNNHEEAVAFAVQYAEVFVKGE